MEDKNFNPAESLSLIDSMIKQAKSAEKDNGLGWILWGWLLFLASTVHYISIKMQWPLRRYTWQVFAILAFVLIIYSFGSRWFNPKRNEVRTYAGGLVGKLSIAFFVSLMVIIYGTNVTGIDKSGINFGFLQILYAFWMFTFAAVFRFKLFYWGAIVNWAGAIIIFYFREKLGAEILLVHAACVMAGYLIPGHAAYNDFKKK